MLFAKASSGGSTPIARRLHRLFAAGVALAISHGTSFAQEAYLRGSVAEDVLSASSPETLANRGLAAPGYDDPGGTDTAISAYVDDNAVGAAYTNYVFRLDNGGAVPEPASWALMVGGFGLMGMAMRRRRPAVTA